jgi:hypothetical protein
MRSLTAFCTFSKARASICFTRSRETPNSFASSCAKHENMYSLRRPSSAYISASHARSMLENTTEAAVDHRWNVDRVAGSRDDRLAASYCARFADRTSPTVLLMLSAELLILINPAGQFGN